jgi:alanine-glyoxylate transaminase / serine-glyoxylate transaminase / serine-pyruvate transaminase
MSKHLKLFTPGPGDVGEEVLEAMATPVLRHYGPDWMEIYNETLALLRKFFNTQNDLFMVPGPASALLDMAIGSLVRSGEKVIIGSNGFFGDRLNDIAQGYGAVIVPFTAPLGQPLDPDVLRTLVRENPDVQVVAFVHHETGTTVMNPLRELAAVAREAGKVTVVDTVSSLGGAELRVDDWGIDVCITAANKCLEAVPGISFISVGPRAWELVDRNPGRNHGWYLNLAVWRKYATDWGAWHPSPVTLPSSNVLAVRASMRRIVQGGLEAHFAKYTHASQTVRRELEKLGLEMFVPEAYASPVVTAVCRRPEFEVPELSQWLAEQREIAIGGAFGPLAGKIFRVGHLGKAAEPEYLDDFLGAMKEFLSYKKVSLPVHTGTAAG